LEENINSHSEKEKGTAVERGRRRWQSGGVVKVVQKQKTLGLTGEVGDKSLKRGGREEKKREVKNNTHTNACRGGTTH